MRSLAIVLYLFIMGCFLLATAVVSQFDLYFYEDETVEEYVGLSEKIAKLIIPQLTGDEKQDAEVLKYWREFFGDTIEGVNLIKSDSPYSSQGAFVYDTEITDESDYINILIPLDSKKFGNKALSIEHYSAYSDEYMWFYWNSIIAIYVFMGGVISIVAIAIYRYINRVSEMTRSVAAGDFSERMPQSRIDALQKLADDLNSMAEVIEEKTQDNIVLTGAIHHELRIPITRIRLALDMALNGSKLEEIQSLLNDMDVDLDELTELMEEILTISSFNLTAVEVPTGEIELLPLLVDIVSEFPQQRVQLEHCYGQDIKLTANRTLLYRAIFNIVSNAEKYAASLVKVRVSNNKGIISIDVEDDGPGIPATERQRVLKPFYRIDKSRNRNTGGFGLGLAIADMAIRHSQGIIEIGESDLGGAHFSLIWER